MCLDYMALCQFYGLQGESRCDKVLQTLELRTIRKVGENTAQDIFYPTTAGSEKITNVQASFREKYSISSFKIVSLLLFFYEWASAAFRTLNMST